MFKLKKKFTDKINKFFYKLKFRFFLKDYLVAMRKRKKFKNNFMLLKHDISDINYSFSNYFTKRIFKNIPIGVEVFFKQYNIYRLIEPDKFNFYLLKSKKIIYPLSNEQILLLEKNNYKVNFLLSKFLFQLYCLVEFIRGLAIFFLILFKSILNLILKRKYNKKYIYIKNLSSNQILSFSTEKNNFKLWIENKLNLNDFNLIHDNKKCKKLFIFNKFLIPEIYQFKEIIKFLYLFFKYNFFIFLDLLFLRSKQLLIYSEIIKLCCSLSKNKEELTSSYFFFNTNAFFRPLSTYALGKNVFFFEYSTNNRLIYYKDNKNILVRDVNKKTADLFTLKNSSWDNYIILDDDQKNRIQKHQLINAKYYNFGPISFGSSKTLDIDFKKNDSILVFDSIAYRKSHTSNFNALSATYIEENIIKFLDDISKLDEKNVFYLKVKRSSKNKHYSKKYLNYINKGNFKLLDYRYNPEDVIGRFKKIICLPFSSTAHIALKLNKKVCFYDVCGIHQDFDDIFKNIPIIRSFQELKKWNKD